MGGEAKNHGKIMGNHGHHVKIEKIFSRFGNGSIGSQTSHAHVAISFKNMGKSSNQFDRSCGYKNWDNIWDTAIWDVTNQQ